MCELCWVKLTVTYASHVFHHPKCVCLYGVCLLQAGTAAKKLSLDVVEVCATAFEFILEHGKQKHVAVTVQQD